MAPTVRKRAAIAFRRKKHFPRGQYDPGFGADYTPAQLAFFAAWDQCQRANRLTSLTKAQVYAVVLSMGHRVCAEAGPLPVF